jgi:hypothetical protein
MPMPKRHEVRPTTVQAVAADYAGRPQSAESAAAFAKFLEANQRQLEALRRLPLKGAEPAMVFRPVEKKHG